MGRLTSRLMSKLMSKLMRRLISSLKRHPRSQSQLEGEGWGLRSPPCRWPH